MDCTRRERTQATLEKQDSCGKNFQGAERTVGALGQKDVTSESQSGIATAQETLGTAS